MAVTSPVLPCRAKNPAQCRFHGPELRAAEAAARQDWDAVFEALRERDANRHVAQAELNAFMLEQQGLPVRSVVYDMTKKKKVAHLEQQILNRDIRFELHGEQPQLVDMAVHMAAAYTPADTVYDIANRETKTEWEHERFLADPLFPVLRQVVDLWQDHDALILGERNLLNPPAVKRDWQDGYKHELARYLATTGSLMRDNASYYGWEDYDYVFDQNRNRDNAAHDSRPYTVVAVLNVKEDDWDEFEGTDNSGSRHTGLTGVGVLQDGNVRLLRVEGELDTILRGLLGGPPRRRF